MPGPVAPDLEHPFLSRQLIAYIGNKRRLLPLIARALTSCGAAPGGLFVDFFAGSGSVAKLAKLAGFAVVANDWEVYAKALAEAFLVTNAADVPGLFRGRGGLAAVLDELNALPAPAPADRLLAEYYAPVSTADADPDRERLFYTRENAERLDAVRAWIERELPPVPGDATRERERWLLLGLLLYEAATHANTSGVFKGFHRGFGGRGGDALTRILGAVELERPELVDGRAEATQEDALALALRLARAGRRIDVAYLDPPYNQHQYGSNYHILTTLARGDKPGVPVAPGRRGSKAGIRPDWTRTKSEYCSRATATRAFAALVGAIDARRILVSYSTEGIIPFETMLGILGRRGRLSIEVEAYTRYPGGKQSLGTTARNVEFVLLVDTEAAADAGDADRILETLGRKKLEVYLRRPVSPAVFVARGYVVDGFTALARDLGFSRELAPGLAVSLTVRNFSQIAACRVTRGGRGTSPAALPERELALVVAELEALTAIPRDEELAVVLQALRYHAADGAGDEALALLPLLPRLLAKFNDRKAYLVSLGYLERVLDAALGLRAGCRDEAARRRFRRFAAQVGRVARRKLAAGGSAGHAPAPAGQDARIRAGLDALAAE